MCHFQLKLYGQPQTTYFRQNKADEFKAATGMNSIIKALLFDLLKGHTLLDIAAGRGADLRRYAEFKNVVAVDNDAAALSELSRRRFDIISRQ